MPSFRMHRARAHRSGNGIYLHIVYYSVMVKAKEFSDFPCRCGHFLPNARAQNFLHARCIAKMRQRRCMKVLRILSGRPAGAGKRHISYFSMLLHSKKHGRGICRAHALIKKPRRVSPPVRRKKTRSFSSATCAAKKILLSLQTCAPSALGGRRVRCSQAAASLSKK